MAVLVTLTASSSPGVPLTVAWSPSGAATVELETKDLNKV
jgi:hypothetical protein